MQEIIKAVKDAQTIAIFPHIMADGDAIGSSLALKEFLDRQGKTTYIIYEEECSYKYQFLFREKKQRYIYPDVPAKRFDLAISIDSGDMSMLGKRAELYKSAPITVNMDHHKTNKMYGDLNYVSLSSAAAGEIIYDFLVSYDPGYVPDTFTASCLYTAITTDTGGFRYANTTKRTHEIAGILTDCGIDVEYICKQVFDLMPKPQMELLKRVLPKASLVHNGKIGIIRITRKDYEEVGAKEEHSDGFVDYVRNVEGVEVAISFKETRDGKVKVSFRSSGVVDVSETARRFNGGGHENAAGCTVEGELRHVEEEVVQYLLGSMAP
jgi:phosphoesterase RecJ-like protein